MAKPFQNETEIEQVVRGFESCTTGVDNFKHREHLVVAVWYLQNSTTTEAFQKMCSGLKRFLDHHGVGRAIYNEELTMSWILLVEKTLAQLDPDLSLRDITNAVMERLADKRIVPNPENNS